MLFQMGENTSNFFKKIGPIPVSFVLYFHPFHITEHRYCALDLNPGPQDGRPRWIH